MSHPLSLWSCSIILVIIGCLSLGDADACQSDVTRVISQCRFRGQKSGINWKRCAIEKFRGNRFRRCSRAQNYIKVFEQSLQNEVTVESTAHSE
ncbi:hypothetical protein D915_004820 [Fasciola hepatica]|uniref:Uncharacterized protein n=1 Tax=Fasciola hepatica TaxID=6192 RepID=A0A4E0RCX4_FASHE|nr:hypothetical protein D915_004820 [Fasciola hepatica]